MNKKCKICPRSCEADRKKAEGLCHGGGEIKIAKAALHYWEEPCISGNGGSGTIFFSGCSLGCCFCQNYKISHENFGQEVSVQRLSDIFLELQQQGANNINLVSPTHYVPWIIEALEKSKNKLLIPVVYNSGGYESVETIQSLSGLVDIYLPDLKYFSKVLSFKYSGASDYFEYASKAIFEMYKQMKGLSFQENGTLSKGLMIRHMVLPGAYKDSIAVLEWIKSNLPVEDILISIMSQYTPIYQSELHPEINRRITTLEYQKVIDYAEEAGFKGYLQHKSSAKEEYTPLFDLEGV